MGRILNLIKGFFSLFVSKVEQEHPEIVYSNAIDSLTEKAVKLRHAAAAVIRRRDDLEERFKDKTRAQKEIEAQVDVAVQNNDAEVGALLLEKKEALDAEIAEMMADLEQGRKDADDVKSALIRVQGERQKLIAEKDRMLAQIASADARVKIQEQLDGLSVDADVKALDNVRTHIKNRVAEARLGQELNESSLDARLDKIKQQTGSVQAQNKFEELRKKHLASQQQGQQGNKTM